jgi:hypothetical protein
MNVEINDLQGKYHTAAGTNYTKNLHSMRHKNQFFFFQ